MSLPPNYLKTIRRRFGLGQEDLAIIFDLPDASMISRFEKGQRSPSKEILLKYELLFDVSLLTLYEQESEMIKETLKANVNKHITKLKNEQITLKNTLSIQLLEEAITNLNKNNYEHTK